MIDEQGNLLVETDFGQLIHRKPICYQDIDNQRRPVEAEFKKMEKNVYGFSVDKYNKDYNLIIDPVVLAYSTYLGGSAVDQSIGIAVDVNGIACVAGYTNSSDFPIRNQYQSDQALEDAFVVKLDTNQGGDASLLYSTYLGGDDLDVGKDIAIEY